MNPLEIKSSKAQPYVFKPYIEQEARLWIVRQRPDRSDHDAVRFFNTKSDAEKHLEELEEEITVCAACFADTEERSSGDEGWTFCSNGCGCLEGHDMTSSMERWQQYELVGWPSNN